MAGAQVPYLVMGVGNPYRGDDAIGPLTVRLMALHPPEAARIKEVQGDAAAIMEAWKGTRGVVVIDAFQTGGKPGTIHRLNVVKQPLPETFAEASTHAFGLAQAVELSRALGELPPRLIVFGIEAEHFEPGAPLSAPVSEAMTGVVDRVQAELDGWGKP